MRTTVFIGRHRAEVASYDTKGDHIRIIISESVDDTAEIQFCDTAKGVDHWPTISLADLRAFIAQRDAAVTPEPEGGPVTDDDAAYRARVADALEQGRRLSGSWGRVPR